MVHALLVLVPLVACVLTSCVATPARYDLRQDGKTNVESKLTNLAFLVMDNDNRLTEQVASGALDFLVRLISEPDNKEESGGAWGDYKEETTEELAEETTSTVATPPLQNVTESGIKKQ